MIKKFFAFCLLATLLSACGLIIPVKRIHIADGESVPGPSLEKIADGVWIHKSYKYVAPWGPILSQGMVVKTDAGLILIDTAWSDQDTAKLLDLIERNISDHPGNAFVTHAHQDKMGGMQAVIDRNWVTQAFAPTNEDAVKRGLTPAQNSILNIDPDITERPQRWSMGRIEFLYPGPGHTRDNIVVYDPKTKILFGGCLIRPAASDNLGNTADADLANWANAVRETAAEFPEAEIIIPSHGPKGGRELFDHTIALAKAAAAHE